MVQVNQGGNSIMLGHWRVVLKQAEESARAGRLDEALALAARSDVADHRQAVKLRGKWALELIARAPRRAEADDLDGALADLDAAATYGAPLDLLAAARLRVADAASVRVRADLDAGEPSRVVDRVEALAARKVSGPALRRARESAEAWRESRAEGRRGEFVHALELLERADRLAGDDARVALAAERRDLDARQRAAAPASDRFYAVLADSPEGWPAILAAAEGLLQAVPEHPAARQARSRAWRQIGAIGPQDRGLPPRPSSVGGEIRFLDEPTRVAAPARPNAHEPRSRPRQDGPEGRLLLWADAIGGFLVCLGDEVVLGRAGPDGNADVPLLGDLARRHAVISRDGEHYTLRAEQSTFLNGRAIDASPLRDGDVIRLGPTVELEFRRPSPVTATATLRLLSRHRLPMAVDGVVLMAQSCLIGSTRQCHIEAPKLRQPVVLFRQGEALWCRCPGGFEVDGRPALARAPLTTRSAVSGDGVSFSLEPLNSQSRR